MAKGSETKIRSSSGELTHQQHETDSPLILVPQLERLHEFRPDAVDWVLKQTDIEAKHRRIEERRTNTFIFVERMLGQFFAWTIGLLGIGFGSFVVLQGKLLAGSSVIGLVLVGLVAALFKDRK